MKTPAKSFADHVSLEVAKKLREAGWPQGGLTWWIEDGDVHWFLEQGPHGLYPPTYHYAAPSISKMLSTGILPENVRLIRWMGMWAAEIFPSDMPLAPCSTRSAAEEPVDALANLWMRLR